MTSEHAETQREPQEAAAPAPAGDGAPGPVTDAADPAAESSGTDPTPEDLAAALAASQGRVAGLTEDLQRLQAEYVNYKRRVDRDRDLVKQNATYSVLSALLPILDDLDRAREHGELEGGFKAIADSLERVVAAQGLVKFGRPGDAFDPRFHEALMHAFSADVTTTTCQNIISAGYSIGERVVRPAQVTVVDPEPASAEPPAAAPDDSGDADGSPGSLDNPNSPDGPGSPDSPDGPDPAGSQSAAGTG